MWDGSARRDRQLACSRRPRSHISRNSNSALTTTNSTATAAKVADLMLALVAESGAALVLVTHDPALAGRLDRRLAVQDGRLAPL